MANEFPNKELLDVIKSQARMEEKLDTFIQTNSTVQTKLSTIEKDVAELKTARREDRAYIAALSAVFGVIMAFIVPAIRKFFGI
jgi:hypothetical protein